MNYPPFQTLTARALTQLLSGKHISHRDFQNAVASYRLSSDIHQLRAMGWPIADIWHVENTRDPTGRVARFKKYFLPEEVITRLGSEGTEYQRAVFVWESKMMQTKGAATPKIHTNKMQDKFTGWES